MKKGWYVDIAVIVIAVMCLGAWWDMDKEAEESAPAVNVPEVIRVPNLLKVVPQKPAFDSPVQVPTIPKISPALSSGLEPLPEMPLPLPQLNAKEIEKIQEELRDIVSRTDALKNRVKVERARVHQIMVRTQIHEEILRGMNVPREVVPLQPLGIDDVVKAEKIKVIVEESRKSREELRAIEQTQFQKPAQIQPIRLKNT